MAGKDGWIRHRGGKCPADLTSLVEVRYRNGSTDAEHIAGELSWFHYGETDDIMAYRIIEEENQEMTGPINYYEGKDAKIEYSLDGETFKPLGEGSVFMKVQSTDGPLDWRDRIREIDAKQIALTNERAELVAKLATEGLALCGEPIKAVSPAQDISNPAEWKAGDLIEIIGEDSHQFEIGEIVRLQVFEDDRDGDGHRYEHLDRRDYWWVKDVNAKFHSRP